MSSKGLKLRPSDASRWTVCTASPKYVLDNAERIPEEKRDYTDEGSRAHNWAEQILNGQASLKDMEDMEMAAHLKGYIQHVNRKLKGDKVQHMVETRIACYYNVTQRGFIDSVIVADCGKKVYIDDLKYGAGVSVAARGNKQLAIYSRSFMDEYADVYGFDDDTLITMCIYQPRIAGEDAVRLWAVTYAELVQWTDDHITDIADDILINPDDQAFAPSDDTCRFCPAAGFCGARADELLEGFKPVLSKEAIVLEDDVFHPPEPESLSDEQIARVLESGSMLTKWIKDVESYARDAMYQGRAAIPGFKVVAGVKHRKWSDEKQALETLKRSFKVAEVTKVKVVSPSQVEKLLKARKRIKKDIREAIEGLIVKPDGGPTLVKESDKRPSIAVDVADELQEETWEDLL